MKSTKNGHSKQLQFDGPNWQERVRALTVAMGPYVVIEEIAKEAIKRNFWEETQVESWAVKAAVRLVRDVFEECDTRGLPYALPVAIPKKKAGQSSGKQWTLFDYSEYEDRVKAIEQRVTLGRGNLEGAQRIQAACLRDFGKAPAIPTLLEPTEELITVKGASSSQPVQQTGSVQPTAS